MDTMMRRRISPVRLAVAAFLSTIFLFAGSAPAQTAAPMASIENAEIGDMLRRGRELELERRWGEAVAYYEDAVRRYPDDAGLRRRFDFTRLHYDVSRRYMDGSYRNLLSQLSFQRALDLYNEVTLKLQAHYVEMPKWKELVERGTNCLEVALSESAFLETHAVAADAA